MFVGTSGCFHVWWLPFCRMMVQPAAFKSALNYRSFLGISWLPPFLPHLLLL
jgi:hypothetical protein